MDFLVLTPSHTINFLIVMVLTGFLILVRFLKKKSSESEHQGNIIEWFAFIFILLSLSIAVINEWNISLFWMFFPYLISASFWIGIAVYNGYHNDIGWSRNYLNTFIILVLIIAMYGILIQIGITLATKEQLFPWLLDKS